MISERSWVWAEPGRGARWYDSIGLGGGTRVGIWVFKMNDLFCCTDWYHFLCIKNEMSSCDTMFRYHGVRLVNLRLPHTVLLNSSVYFLLHDHFCLCLIDLIMIQTFLFVLSAALCLRFSIHTSLLVSLTSSRSRGTKKKWWRDKCNCGYFCISVLIYSCLFFSLFDFLIYYNLAIYMNKAVRSVECYLLPSCVFVNGATFEEKMNFFFLLLWSAFNRIMWTSTSHKFSLRRGKENLWELLKKNYLPVI